MPTQYRLAAIDLDETLIGRDGSIPPRNARAIAALREAGIVCVIASGRMHQATLRFADAVGLEGPVISYNGAMIRDRTSGETWRHVTVPSEPASEVVRFCADNGYHLNYYLDDHLYVADVGEWAEFYRRHTGSLMEPIGDLRKLDGTRPTKMILIDRPEEADRLYAVMTERYGDRLYITRTNPEYLEFMAAGCDKGKALEELAGRLGIAQSQTLAFGDGGNDLPMMQWAGFSVAMGSAKQAIRDAASWVAPPFDADGFAIAVEEILSGRIG